jgi:hypothetical protein
MAKFTIVTSELIRRKYAVEFDTDNVDEAVQLFCDMDEEDKENSMIWNECDDEQIDALTLEKETGK